MTKSKWRRRGFIFQARYRQTKLRLSQVVDGLRVKKLTLELRYLKWKADKLEQLDRLAESKAFQRGGDDE